MFPRTGKTAKIGRYVPEGKKCEHPDVNDIEIIFAFHVETVALLSKSHKFKESNP